jgi:2-methylisocitrate lyase-like PEP mutase family enzyme
VTADALRAMLAGNRVTHVPGVWDPASAALAVRAGHRAVHLSGAAVAAAALGRPDLGFVNATQIADRAATLAPALAGVPLLADADVGFDSPLHSVWTALSYARAGISGLVLADLDSAGQAAAKLTALATEVPQVAVIARTGAYATGGLGAAIERCRQYAEAGADAVLADGVNDPADLARLHRALPGVPLAVELSEAATRGTPISDSGLAEAGVRLVLHPMAALLAALRAVSLTYRAILDEGNADLVDRLPWAAFSTLAERADDPQPHTPGLLGT